MKDLGLKATLRLGMLGDELSELGLVGPHELVDLLAGFVEDEGGHSRHLAFLRDVSALVHVHGQEHHAGGATVGGR